MITDETSPEDFVNDRKGDYSHIKGWGIDADRRNDPTYPMKKRNDAEQRGYTWDRPPLQEETTDVEILKSVERPNLTAVFGTARPPSGLSGTIRRMAYKYSESTYARWLPLVIADRVDVVEGILDDFAKGQIPNIPKEIGLKADWKYDKPKFFKRVAIGLALTGALIWYLTPSKPKTAKAR
ncbi:MAG: hypothetical protein EOO48_12180 [Flavobacterium sp.]|nr:MAG: hypothetical protein EOO48_12180 [Flavobacterium sp.]